MHTQPDRRPAWRWILAALAAEAAIALAIVRSAAPPPGLLLTGLLLTGPLLAAHRLGVRLTAAASAAATCLALVLPAAAPPPGRAFSPVGALLVTAGGGLAVLAARSRSRRNRTLAQANASLTRMAHIADVAQRAIVRPLPAELGGVALAAHSRSATDGALIGGDVHDAVARPDGARLLIADVKGHGIDVAPLAATVLAAFRHHAATEPDPVRLARTIDARLRPELGPEDFVTLLLADFVDGEVRLVNCGHPPPLRIGRRVTPLDPPRPSPPLGLEPEPLLHRVRLAPAQRLLFYTDGLTDAGGPRGEELAADVLAGPARTAPDLQQALAETLDLIRPRAVSDDLTLVLAQPLPAPAPERAPPAAEAADR
ncbi:PP2C family protein-serine/threonine phosphatase [Actinomadura parmotrematis]|uniref:Serine/threonine-protein phosphatase n=1 Tax=Actinomadura parmotrematis TaxID=2864039 RepID=A0ABS7FRY0_9ACTN|nr:PP2C family protein-serine/threonine phosphatase [Actinomadura parmotrematis]MBW8483142.1 serine/threonine-protein phosphatase [Actinomadura parmotrematis]